MGYSLKEIAAHIGARIIDSAGGTPAGAEKIEIEGVASVASATARALAFVEDEKFLSAALDSKAGAVIAGPFADGRPAKKPLLICAHPRLAFARAAAMLAPPAKQQPGTHPSAVVHSSARLSLAVSVAAHCSVGAGAVIGPRTQIKEGVSIGDNVRIGEGCMIGPSVTIHSGAVLGDRVVVKAGAVLGADGFGFVRDPASGRYEKFPQIGRLVIADDVEIGANCTIDRGALETTSIGRGVKLDNLVHIGHNVQIGEDVVIAAQSGISGSSVIGNKVIIGGQVGIADHVRVEDGAILGAKCGVPSGKTLKGGGIVYWGIPARPLKQHLKELAVLARMAKSEKG